MRELATQFIPAADEVSYLQHAKTPDATLFQQFCELGHFGHRVKPSNTRQGMYAVTPNGTFLASTNRQEAKAVSQMLEQALARWAELDADQRHLTKTQRAGLEDLGRPVQRFDQLGLVLAVTSRDLGDQGGPGSRWNRDWAWFTRDEAQSFVPDSWVKGATRPVPSDLTQRLARCHLLDHVRGQTEAYRAEHITAAELQATITALDGDVATLELTGATCAAREGHWPVAGFHDQSSPDPQQQGVKTKLLGRARFDRHAQRFLAFELLAVGMRHGGTQFNARSDDLTPTPIGFVLGLPPANELERVEPAQYRAYGWR